MFNFIYDLLNIIMMYDQRDTFDNKFKINERLLCYMYIATKST